MEVMGIVGLLKYWLRYNTKINVYLSRPGGALEGQMWRGEGTGRLTHPELPWPSPNVHRGWNRSSLEIKILMISLITLALNAMSLGRKLGLLLPLTREGPPAWSSG